MCKFRNCNQLVFQGELELLSAEEFSGPVVAVDHCSVLYSVRAPQGVEQEPFLCAVQESNQIKRKLSNFESIVENSFR